MKRAFIMVLDSFGIGATEDAERFGDVGADTLGHIAEACAKGEADHGRKGPLNLPNLTRLGLAKAHEGSTGFIPAGMDGNAEVIGAYAWAHEMSSGKDTPSGHWEIAGVPVLFEWGYFSDHENSFPQELLDKLVERANLPGYLGNCQRTGNRHDLAVEPPAPTVLQKLVDEKHGQVVSVGKIADIYANCGITKKVKATGLDALFDATIKEMKEAGDNTIVFTNFVDFDSSWGHRRDVAGYAAGLELFDRRLPELMSLLRDDDILILTADHGCDPTWTGTDHTREHIPVLVYGPKVKPGSLGHRETFADIGQTLAKYFGTSDMEYGKAMF
ncbi:TPA: phosphopentomutase [Escherichia coli O25b:H4-ST131]|nr:phosphopentomutase [Escherichia coli O25b:H4-ST131]